MPADDEDEPASGPPPHPLDRTWLHPAELGSLTRPPARPPGARRRDWLLALSSGVAGAVMALLVVGAIAVVGDDGTAPRAKSDEPSRAERERAAELAAAVRPSVVSVRVGDGSDTTAGSGVCVDGRIVTTSSLVGDTKTVEVRWASGSTATARVVGVDPETDLALIEVQGAPPDAAARKGSTLTMRTGQMVVAVGTGRGDEQWVGSGVVSATGSMARSAAGTLLAGLIESDIAVSRKAAGGALVDASGAVIGIVTTGVGEDERSVAYVVPIEVVVDVASQLAAGGRALHGWLGIEGADTEAGVKVEKVLAGSPAAGAGIAPGDVVARLDGQPLEGMAALLAAVRSRQPGTEVSLVVERDSGSTTKLVTLADSPD